MPAASQGWRGGFSASLCNSTPHQTSHRTQPLQGVSLVRKKDVAHGTTTMYRRGCRCALCVQAKSSYMRDYMQIPGVKRKRREVDRIYKKRPEVLAKKREYQLRRRKSPAVKKLDRQNWVGWKYGITQEQYQAIIAAQGGLCPGCGSPLVDRRAHIDHDHVSGRVRGVLCSRCNMILRDDMPDSTYLKLLAYRKNPPATGILYSETTEGRTPLELGESNP